MAVHIHTGLYEILFTFCIHNYKPGILKHTCRRQKFFAVFSLLFHQWILNGKNDMNILDHERGIGLMKNTGISLRVSLLFIIQLCCRKLVIKQSGSINFSAQRVRLYECPKVLYILIFCQSPSPYTSLYRTVFSFFHKEITTTLQGSSFFFSLFFS